MKIISLITFVILSFYSISQRSILFENPLPTRDGVVHAVDRVYHGTYKSPDEMINYIFDDTGVTVFSTTVSSISKEMIRETGKYDVRNGFLFGVVEDDSIPCVLDKDRYYFGLRNNQIIVGQDSKNKLTKIGSSEYILNTFEDGNYIPTRIKFTSRGCEISYFDYDDEDTFFDNIGDKKELNGDYFDIILLNPDSKETQELLKQSIFSDNQFFTKI